jgi:glycosyltransferase involved in cell wall biosynthesis
MAAALGRRGGVVRVRVVHVITKGDVGGAQTHVAELAGAQVRAGLDVCVVAGTGGPALDRCEALGCAVSVVPTLGEARARLWQRTAMRDLGVALVDARPDVVHAHSSNAGFLARIVCRRAGIPCIYTAHGWPFQRGAAWRQRVLSFAGEFVGGRIGDGVICLTEAEAARARRARVARPDRLWVVPNGLADVPPDLVRRHTDGPAHIVMVARFAPPKLQRELIDTLARLLDVPWTLSFVGDGPELDACRVHGTATLGDRVAFLGHRDDVASLLAEHDVLVLWSAYEGLPISILEGLRAGLCCVASDLAGVHVLFGGRAGLLARTDAELEQALRSVLADPGRRARLGAEARATFTDRFAIESVEQQVRHVYATVRGRRTSMAPRHRPASR